ncbi:MAG TPA: tetratricopeptide repeat protein, partial [Candidatus Kapabacteria bacterium]|nr:tetratricopeptide repeat protein [Candidatus Kapabacteria bacterium]
LAAVDAAIVLREKVAFPKMGIVYVVVLCGVAGWWGYSTFEQDAYWKDDLTLFTEMRDYAPESPVLYFSLANGYRYNGDYVDAARFFTEAVRLFPLYHDAYLNLGACYMILGDHHPDYYKTAIDTYDKAIASFPKDPNFYMLMGDACLHIGDTQRAIQEYATAYSLDKSPEIRMRLDRLHVQLPGE